MSKIKKLFDSDGVNVSDYVVKLITGLFLHYIGTTIIPHKCNIQYDKIKNRLKRNTEEYSGGNEEL